MWLGDTSINNSISSDRMLEFMKSWGEQRMCRFVRLDKLPSLNSDECIFNHYKLTPMSSLALPHNAVKFNFDLNLLSLMEDEVAELSAILVAGICSSLILLSLMEDEVAELSAILVAGICSSLILGSQFEKGDEIYKTVEMKRRGQVILVVEIGVTIIS